METDLRDVRDSLQNAIGFAFPIDSKGTMHAVFTEQLSLSYDQAVARLESLSPLFKTTKTGGLSDGEDWSRVLVYTKALMEDVKTVRSLSASKNCAAMIWGSFNTSELLLEYMRFRWIQHPQVSSILALTSLQREVKAMNEAVAALNFTKTTIATHTTQITATQHAATALKRDNPNLK